MVRATAAAPPVSDRSLARHESALVALLLALAPAAGCKDHPAAAPPGTALLVSDFHFNPLADPALADQLVQAPVAQWDAIFATSTVTAYSPYGTDTNFLLLQSALAEMQARAPHPDVVLITGDFLVHQLQRIFDASVTAPTQEGYVAFADKTEQYLALKLAGTFPDAQLVPTLGDWDTTGAITGYPDAAFIAAFASTWTAAVNRLGGAPGIQDTFAAGGYFSTDFPVDPGGRLVVLYTQPWAAECASGCGTDAGSPGAIELAWLASQLDDARRRGQRVWLLGHIPPGVGATATAQNTAQGGACPGAIVPYYADAYATQLQALYREYRGTIAFGFFAHEHSDDFRLLRDSVGSPIFGMKLVPSIAPLHGNAPAFVVIAYDPAAGAMTDATTFRLTNLAAATTTAPGAWEEEYGFDQAYGQSAFDTTGVAGAVTGIQTDAAARATYEEFLPSSSPAGDPAGGFTPFLAYACALDRLTVEDFAACYCGN
jgi:sphingomyelin phosphodiesterase acid-like 3